LHKFQDDILIRRFLLSAELHSSRPALEVQGESYSYRELLSISSHFAQHILSTSIDDAPVAILAQRNITAYAGILAALMAGRAYLPLNPRFPISRNLKMMQRSGTGTVIVSEEGNNIPDEMNIINPVRDNLIIKDAPVIDAKRLDNIDKAQTAYLLFTSGTTGEPKGVPVSNMNVCAYLDHMLGHYDFDENDRFSQTFDLTFDLSVHDLFVCWLSGACLCIPDSDTPFAYPKYINEQQVSVWFSVPSLAVLMDKMRLLRLNYFPGLRWSFFCGEALLEKTASAWQQAASSSRVVNLYGPSETTIAISAYEWRKDKNKIKNGIVSIGKVFKDQQYRVLSDKDDAVQAAEQGYLHLSGSQAIASYLDESDNQHAFKDLGEIENRNWYNTGDLVIEDEDHDLLFIGRADHEVKISGYRVNLLAIDDTLRQLSSSINLATIAVQDEKTDAQSLVSFIETRDNFDEHKLLELCRNELPWYMVPQRIMQIDHLPLNENGKIDRMKLLEIL